MIGSDEGIVRRGWAIKPEGRRGSRLTLVLPWSPLLVKLNRMFMRFDVSKLDDGSPWSEEGSGVDHVTLERVSSVIAHALPPTSR